jgi:hypothetical protein
MKKLLLAGAYAFDWLANSLVGSSSVAFGLAVGFWFTNGKDWSYDVLLASAFLNLAANLALYYLEDEEAEEE